MRRCYGCMREVEAESGTCPKCGWPREQDNEFHQLPVGTVLRGRYTVGRVLGQGGFGITYLGWDEEQSRIVAVKEFYPGSLVNRESSRSLSVRVNSHSMEAGFGAGRERFLREAQALAKLKDVPQVVGIHDSFPENDTAYIVMEYIRGVELRKYVDLKGGRLEQEECFRILKPILRALETVHAEGLVHRDISPDNILLDPMGGAKLLDFGAVRSVEHPDAEKDMTHSTEAIVKHGFAPMEQYRNRGSLGPWTDEYALCATAYYCLTGRIPPDAMARAMGDEGLDWSGVPDLTPRRRRALEKGMAIKAKDRFPDMKALREALYGKDSPAPKPEELKEVKPKKQRPAKAEKPANAECPPKEEREKKQRPAKAEKPANAERPPKEEREKKQRPVKAEKPAKAEQPPKEEKTKKQRPPREKPVKTERPRVKRAGKDRPEKERPEKDRKPIPRKPVLIAAAALALILAVILIPDWGKTEIPAGGTAQLPIPEEPTAASGDEQEPSETAPEEDTVPRTEQTLLGAGVMMADPLSRLVENKNDLVSVSFTREMTLPESGCVDLSADGDGSVLGYFEDGAAVIWAENGVDGSVACPALFAGCERLETVTFGDAFHTENAASMEDMFLICRSLHTVDVENLDTSNVTSMRNMFNMGKQAWALDGDDIYVNSNDVLTFLDVSGWDVSKVEDMSGMFVGCKFLEELDVSSWDVGSVRNMKSFFQWCEHLQTLAVGDWDVSNVTSMEATFHGCYALKELDVSKWDTGSVTTMKSMFDMTTELYDDTGKVDGYSLPWLDDSLRTLDVSGWNVSNVTDMSSMFLNCNMLESLDVSRWDVSSATDMTSMFEFCLELRALDVSQWDVGKVESMSCMFFDCSSLQNLNVSRWDVSSVTDMASTFSGCASIAYLDVGDWNVSNVENMCYTFRGMTNLCELDVSGWDVSRVGITEGMFQDCIYLVGIDVSRWNTENLFFVNEMFRGCEYICITGVSNWNLEGMRHVVDPWRDFAPEGLYIDGQPWEYWFEGVGY